MALLHLFRSTIGTSLILASKITTVVGSIQLVRWRAVFPTLKERRLANAMGDTRFVSGDVSSLLDPVADRSKWFLSHKGYLFARPYGDAYSSLCKGDWVGLTVLEVFRMKFPFLSEDDMDYKFANGWVQINGDAVTKDKILWHGDRLNIVFHRHEPPIRDLPMNILAGDDDIFIASKPPSIPIHPVGRYQRSTLQGALLCQYGHSVVKGMYPIHRIDRLVSGLVVFAKTRPVAMGLGSAMFDRRVRKYYLARVCGDFPDEEIIVDRPVGMLDKECVKYGCSGVESNPKDAFTVFRGFNSNNSDGIGNTEVPLRFGGRHIQHTSKGSSTTYEKDDIDEMRRTTTLVLCEPRTGRPHQLRVHLAHLGFPIANDVKYGGTLYVESSVEDLRSLTWPEGLVTLDDCRDCRAGGFERSDVKEEHLNDEPICLHALRYEFYPKFRKGRKEKNDNEVDHSKTQTEDVLLADFKPLSKDRITIKSIQAESMAQGKVLTKKELRRIYRKLVQVEDPDIVAAAHFERQLPFAVESDLPPWATI